MASSNMSGIRCCTNAADGGQGAALGAGKASACAKLALQSEAKDSGIAVPLLEAVARVPASATVLTKLRLNTSS